MRNKKTYTAPASETLDVKMQTSLLTGSDLNLYFLDGNDLENLDGTRGDYTGNYESKWF